VLFFSLVAPALIAPHVLCCCIWLLANKWWWWWCYMTPRQQILGQPWLCHILLNWLYITIHCPEFFIHQLPSYEYSNSHIHSTYRCLHSNVYISSGPRAGYFTILFLPHDRTQQVVLAECSLKIFGRQFNVKNSLYCSHCQLHAF